jgi:hypothetical protein
LATENIRINYQVDKSQLEASNEELKKTVKANNLTQKEVEETTKKYDEQNKTLAKTNKSYAGLGENIKGASKSTDEFKDKINTTVKDQEVFGTSVSKLGTKFGLLAGGIGATVAIIGGLAKAYLSSARGTEDLARASDRLNSIIKGLGNTIADSVGDNFFDKFLAVAQVQLLGVESFAESQIEVMHRASLRKTEIEEFELERSKKKQLQEAEILRQQRDEERNSIEERNEANDKLFEVIKAREEETVSFFDNRIRILNKLLAADKENLELQQLELNEDQLTLQIARLEGQILEEEEFSEKWIELQRQVINTNKKLQLDAAGENKQRRSIAIQEAINLEKALDEQVRINREQSAEQDRKAKEEEEEKAREAEALAIEERKEAITDLNIFRLEQAEMLEEAEMERRKRLLENDLLLEEERQLIIEESEARITEIKEKESEEQQKISQTTRDAEIQARKEGVDVIAGLIEQGLGDTKAAAIFSAGIQTKEAAVAAYKSVVGIPVVGPILAPIAAGAAITFGLQNIAQIKNTPAKFEEGGRIGGKRHSQGGTLIEAEVDEFVMSRKATSKYGFDFMDKINNLELNELTPVAPKTSIKNMPQNVINIDSEGFGLHQRRGQHIMRQKLERYST